MKVTVEIPEKTLAYVLDDCGRHINYWADDAKRPEPFVLRIRERTSQQWYRVGVRRALETMSRESPKHFAMLLNGEYDGNTCDLFVQYGCFGKAVYG